MSSMKGKNTLLNNASKVSSFSKDIEFKESKVPEPSDDFISKFKDNSGASKDFSNQHIINVFPNFVPILCYILYHVNQYVPHLEHTKHAKISAGTFTAYCLAILYGYILCCDLYVRPSPSMHASLWEDEVHRQRFVEFLMTLPVPDFLDPIIKNLTPTTSERRANILFVPSAAGFMYSMFFGRFFPLIMFTNIHDLAAETPANTNPAEVLYAYFSRTLYTITRPREGITSFAASPAHFLGTCFTSGSQLSSYGSKLEQLFQSVFNPVLFRDYQRRQSLASVALRPATYPSRFMNFYDLVFSASPANLSELRVVFQSISGAMQGNVKCPGDLASYFKNFSGQSILRHGYSFYQLPTWHHSAITFPTSNYARPRRVSPDDFSAAIRFLRTPTLPTATTLNQPTGTCSTDRGHTVTISYNRAWNRLSSTDGTPPAPSLTTDFVTFDEGLHLYPKVYVFGLDGSSVDAWTATAFGLVIETADIDGTVVPVPNTNLSLGIENSWFADSAVPYKYCYWSIMFDTAATTSFSRARARVLAPRQTRFPAASLLVDRTVVNVPQFNTAAHYSSTAALFAGLTNLTNVNWPQMIQHFLGFRTTDNRSAALTEDESPGTPFGRLLVWSPYTYVSIEGNQDFVADHAASSMYFITNLRTLFGTDVPLVKVSNGLEAMPVF